MSIWLEFDALGSGAGSSRRDQFLMELLETPLPEVYLSAVDDEAQLFPATRSPTLNAGGPRLVDGDRESHIVPGYQQTARDWGSNHAAMKILAQGSQGDPTTTARSGEEYFSKADGDISHSHCLKFLCRKEPSLLIENLKDKEKVCSVLLNTLPGDILNLTLWRASLWALVQEMKTVAENFPSLIGNSGVYVLAASPYSAFLRALAAEIADRRS